jgi:hypothetical protein
MLVRRRAIRSVWVLLAACLLIGLGCSGEESFALPPLEGGAPETRHQAACTAWAQSICGYERRCDRASFRWQTVDQCTARETLRCELMAGDPSVAFDDARVGGCQYPSDCTSEIPPCWPAGKTREGLPCLWGTACQSGVCSGAASSLGVCGVCLCGAGCPSGQTCGVQGAAAACVPAPRASGQPCATSSDCQSGLCAAADGGQAVCAAFAAIGDGCGTGEPFCGSDAYCDATEYCSAFSLAPYGAACGPAGDGGAYAFCGGFAACIGESGAPGSCIPPVGDGEPCDPNGGLHCLPPAQCIASHCIFPSVADCAP